MPRQHLPAGRRSQFPIDINYGKLALEPPRVSMLRPRLIEALGRGPRPRVVLLCAPAGFGKSTLLYQLLSNAESPVVYYRLSPTDRDIPQFVSYLTAGICRHEPRFGARLRTYLNASYDVPSLWDSLRDLLVHEVTLLAGHKLWIMLDDYQQVEDSPEIAALVGELADALPSGLRLIVASRGTPPLPCARWRVQGDLLEIGADQLAFSWTEARLLFREVAMVPLEDEPIRAIHSMTEGWAAGLALASQVASLHPAEETVRIVQGFGESGSPVYGYLAEQVYRGQPEPVRQFLRRSSVLKYLSADLCNEVLGMADAGPVLEGLYRGGVFLLAVPESGRVFRYHQLFREFLHAKLGEEETQESVQRLRTAAGRALESRQEWDEAIQQYALGGDVAGAGELIARFGEDVIEAGQVERVSQWLRQLPKQLVDGDPRLLALRGLIDLRLGNTPTALRTFERCKAFPANEATRRVGATVANHAGIALYREGRFGEAIRLLEEAIGQVGEDPRARIDLQRALGVACRGAGRLAEGERHLREVLRLLRIHADDSTRGRVTLVAVLRALAWAKIFEGDLDAAVELSLDLVRTCEAQELGDYQQMQALTALGASLALKGQFQEAMRALEGAGEKGADFYPRKGGLVAGLLGNVWRDLGDPARAARHYEQAGERYAADFAFLLLGQGEVQRSLRLAQAAIASRTSLESPPERAAAEVSYGLGLAAVGMSEMAAQTLEAAAETFREYGYLQRFSSVAMHLAALWQSRGDQGRAHLWLRRWLSTARRRRLCHFHWWDSPLFARLAAEALRQRVEVDFTTQLAVRRLGEEDLAALWSRAGARAGETAPLLLHDGAAEPIDPVGGDEPDLGQLLATCRDPQVVATVRDELDAGRISHVLLGRLRVHFHLTWKEILIFLSYYLQAGREAGESESGLRARVAAELCISENTLKCHVASIRRKLDIPHRIGTVGLMSWGAERGILPPAPVAFSGKR